LWIFFWARRDVVDEATWLGCTDPQEMLGAVRANGKPSDRKLRLFACACVRRVWHLLAEGRSRDAVEAAERVADGQTSPPGKARADAHAAAANQAASAAAAAASAAVAVLQESSVWGLASGLVPAGLVAAGEAASAAALAVKCAARARGSAGRPAAKGERAYQCKVLRCVFGNPFRPLSAAASGWLAWNEGAVRLLAEAAYEQRDLPAGTLDPARLAILADALEEAGCTEAELLGHLRGPGPHVRGCWAVDLVLGRT
jgi:hypothetical protein